MKRREFFAVLLVPFMSRPALTEEKNRFCYVGGPRRLFENKPAASPCIVREAETAGLPVWMSHRPLLNGSELRYCVAADESGWAMVIARNGNNCMSARDEASLTAARRDGRELISDGALVWEVLRGEVRLVPVRPAV